ncbi:magnesium/cobalt transporter CorA [Desulfoscipio gibsoniae]|uniref:Magnesium transport protein CorA n=1 Tax=Desulfoscipio gibsoniae DSM 7213 TaxID=767817 RepID=R4KJZ1_9FIRM|nr:magnesium/cobalt transporter CorA [Desulfoscipio gibsoniae]AGL00860.1 magnesium Mg(2+) and cobalt Co(2+) transport protein CorA [Desulfoscipio gibsoniae DSM 7213]
MIKTYFYDATRKLLVHDVDLTQKDLIQHEDDLLWVDLYDFENGHELNYLAGIFDFHYLAVEDCLQQSPRAKVDAYDKYYFFMLHALRYKEDSDEEIMLEQLNVFLSSNYVVTVHRRTLPTLGRMARECLSNRTKYMEEGSDMFLYHILDGITDEYFPILDRIDQRVDELEDQLYEQASKEITEEFLALKRTILSMRRAILPQKRMFSGLNGQFVFQISKESEPYYLDLVDHIERIIDSIDGFRDLLDGALETYYSIISARTNESIRVLAVISFIFMPLTFVTGFFGMNVPLPEQHSPWSTVAIAAGLMGVTAWMFLVFKMKKWI